MNTIMFNYTTKVKETLGDLHTPIETYLKVRDLYSQSVLMESSDFHSKENSFSFIGLCPIGEIGIAHGYASMVFPDGSTKKQQITEGYRVENAFNDFLDSFKVEGEYNQYCGLYGYTTFNAVRYFEDIKIKDSMEESNDAADMRYVLYKYVIVFNAFTNKVVLIEMLKENEEGDISRIEKAISSTRYTEYGFRRVGEIRSTLTDQEHKANIRRGIEHCKRGDVFQIVMSRRFIQNYSGDDFKLYRALRSINPSPYLFYFDFGGYRIFGSSPETHCRIENGKAYIDPIAGTTKRTGDDEIDAKLAVALQANPKENAEHVMLVDLARNDLSRNCKNVKVDFYKDTQYYSHVIHLVSRVSGDLNPGTNSIKAFIDTFPAGTLTGAPKIRAMQLISEIEPHNRGAYGGCIGFIGVDGSLNQAITIRTFVSRNNELWFQAGGGIVAKGDDEYELQEVNNKLGALKKAILMAEQM